MDDITSKKYFCYEIYKNLSICSKNNKLLYSPCSFYSGHFHSDDKFDLKKVWNGTGHTNLKKNIENNIAIPGCSYCYNEEKSGLLSRRISAKNAHENFFKSTSTNLDVPTSIDYSVGNLCNLKCVICGPANSTSWLADWQKLQPEEDISFYKFDKFNQIEVKDTNLLKNITNVHFHGGGEPLLSSSHVNLLKAIKQEKGLGDIRVYYNTNGTVRVSDEVLELWSECRLLELYFSIDDIGDRFNYQRSGAKWEDLVDNIEWYKKVLAPNHLFKINCTWSYLNLFYLDQLLGWYTDNFNQNRLGDSTQFILQKAIGICAINSASNKVIDILLEKFNSYPELINIVNTLQRDDSNTHQIFFNYIQKLDTIRNTKFDDICPDWVKILTYNV